jgi:hypothetical protein
MPTDFNSNRIGINVTVLGVLQIASVAPTCSVANPPCALQATLIYYVVVNGRNYRLVLSDGTSIPDNVSGWNAVVTGSYVTPSKFEAGQWTPPLYFFGDIHVHKITYYQTLPK